MFGVDCTNSEHSKTRIFMCIRLDYNLSVLIFGEDTQLDDTVILVAY